MLCVDALFMCVAGKWRPKQCHLAAKMILDFGVTGLLLGLVCISLFLSKDQCSLDDVACY